MHLSLIGQRLWTDRITLTSKFASKEAHSLLGTYWVVFKLLPRLAGGLKIIFSSICIPSTNYINYQPSGFRQQLSRVPAQAGSEGLLAMNLVDPR